MSVNEVLKLPLSASGLKNDMENQASTMRRWMCIYVALFAVCAGSVSAQGLTSVFGSQPKPAPASESSLSDPWKRTTPRSAVYNFLEACHSRDFARAERYLDLSKLPGRQQQENGPDLAQQLAALLDHDVHFDIGQLSDDPNGNLDDGLPSGFDKLATVEQNGDPVTLTLQNQQRGDIKVWLVSAETVQQIPDLTAAVTESRIERIMPAALVRIKFVGTSLWIWLALILTALLLSILSRLLSRVVLALVRPILKRYSTDLEASRLTSFTEPLRFLLWIAAFRACEEAFTPSALLRHYINNFLTLVFFLSLASLAMRIVDLLVDHVGTRLDGRQRGISSSVLPLFGRIAKICIFCVAILFTLEAWDYPVATILAGVGVGGLAVALAAQKTLENLFGGVSVISDRPVLVGDFCQFGGQVGTVEDIGLRSTRIRTLDRTVVTIPNAQFSTMTLENYSRRDQMWFHPTLKLRRDTHPATIKGAMDAIVNVLKTHPQVNPTDVPVRFTKITDQSFDLEIFAYVMTADFNEFLKAQSELLLKLLAAVNEAGAGLAVPLQESVLAPINDEELHAFGMKLSGSAADHDGIQSKT